MTKLNPLTGKPIKRTDWHSLADAWGAYSNWTLQELAPDDVECTTCWDWDTCAECLGLYPRMCPSCDEAGTTDDGRCGCKD